MSIACRLSRTSVRSANKLLSPHSSPTKKGQRFFTSSPKHAQKVATQRPKVAVVSGASGTIANVPITKLASQGIKVIGLTSNPERLKQSTDQVQFVHVPRTETGNPVAIKGAVEMGMRQFNLVGTPQMIALNLLGGGSKNGDTRHANYTLPLTFLKTVKAVGEQCADRVSLVHISSIAPRINGDHPNCHYSQIRKATDEAVIDLSPKNGDALVLCPGIVCPEADPSGVLHMGHDYSPEQSANMLVIPVVGSGEQIQQPVTESDLFDAAIDGVQRDGRVVKIVDAVGSEALTQKQVFSHFAQRAVGFIHIPTPLAQELVKSFPLGRFDGYSINLLEAQDQDPEKNKPRCGKDFEELLGRRAVGFREFYKPDQLVVTRKGPVFKHAWMILTGIAANPAKAAAIVQAAATKGWAVSRNTASAPAVV